MNTGTSCSPILCKENAILNLAQTECTEIIMQLSMRISMLDMLYFCTQNTEASSVFMFIVALVMCIDWFMWISFIL